MSRKRCPPEKIIDMLREATIDVAQGETIRSNLPLPRHQKELAGVHALRRLLHPERSQQEQARTKPKRYLLAPMATIERYRDSKSSR